MASSTVAGDRTMTWSSAPHFKRAAEQLIAYAWAVELAEASHHLLFEFAAEYRLGYFGQSPTPTSEGETT